jgi:hypothetical protein
VPSEGVTEFGGWPQPPRWVWVVAGFAAAAVLAGVAVARAGPHHAAPSSPKAATAPVRVGRIPAEGPVAVWPAAPSACGGTVRLWNPATGHPVGAPVPTRTVFGAGAVAFSPNGKPLAITCGDGTVWLWNPVTGRRTGSIDHAHGVVGAGPVDPS